MSSATKVASIAALLAAILAGGCARAQARVAPEMPPLEMPEAPPRVIAPIEVAEAPQPAPAEPEPATPDPKTNGRQPRPIATAPKPEPARTEPDARAASSRPPTRVSTPLSASDAEVERRIRETVARASRILDTLNYAGLSAEGKTQYDTARSFLKEATEGLEAKNFVFAGLVADKAETFASALIRR
jgi:hypothetical protein